MQGEELLLHYERKGNSSGKNHEPEYEKNDHRTDGSRGIRWSDRGPDRYGPDRQHGGRRRRKRGDRPRGTCAPRA